MLLFLFIKIQINSFKATISLSLSLSSCRMNDVDVDVAKQKGKTRLFIHEFVISVQIKSLTWMISVHVKEIISKILRSNHLSHASVKRNLRFSH
jgi:hypothetical protein